MKNLSPILLLILFWGQAFAQTKDTIVVNPDIQLVQLKDSFFLHITRDEVSGFGTVASNGLFVIRGGKALMIDTPMDETKTAILLNFLRDSMNVEVSVFIPGHWHNDCIGGLALLHRMGVFSLSNVITANECIKRNLAVPRATFSDSLFWSFGGVPIELYYPGPGHSIDNIVVYFPDQKILFGGCLIKSPEAQTIGNVADGDVNRWNETLEKVRLKYGLAGIVIPGHGSVGSMELIKHTQKIVDSYSSTH